MMKSWSEMGEAMKLGISISAAAVVLSVLLSGCSSESSSGSQQTNRAPETNYELPADGSFNPDYRSSTNLVDGFPETVNGVVYPGYVDQEMDLAYQDCYMAADSISLSNPPGTDSYWTAAEDAWVFSSPPQYGKSPATEYACYFAYLVVQQNFL